MNFIGINRKVFDNKVKARQYKYVKLINEAIYSIKEEFTVRKNIKIKNITV